MSGDESAAAAALREWLGGDEAVSDWIEVSQELIDRFADATHDHNWLHVDPERAANESPTGGTIAHGFWTLSLLSHFLRTTRSRDLPPGALYAFNYGLDRVRLMAPVPVGSRVRNHSRLLRVRERGEGRVLVKTSNRVEVEGADKPAMVAEWLFMFVYPEGHR